MHVLNTSNDKYYNDYVTCMYDNMVSQHFHSSQANERSHISSTFPDESLLCSTQQTQQVSVGQVTAPEVQLLSASSNISVEASQHESISLPDSQDHNALKGKHCFPRETHLCSIIVTVVTN